MGDFMDTEGTHHRTLIVYSVPDGKGVDWLHVVWGMRKQYERELEQHKKGDLWVDVGGAQVLPIWMARVRVEDDWDRKLKCSRYAS